MELQDIQGNIGIKVRPEDVEVNMSREAVLWTDKTKEKVLHRFEQVVEIAAKHIQEELRETDFVKWLRTCHVISSRYSEQKGIIGRLAKIVDLSEIDLHFGPNPKITYKEYRSLGPLWYRRVFMMTDRKGGTTKKKIQRDNPISVLMSELMGRPLILLKQDEKVSNRTDKYLMTLYPDGFIQIHEPYDTLEQMLKADLGEMIMKHYEKSTMNQRRMLWDALTESSEVLWYSNVQVPEDFKGTDEEEDVHEEPKNEEEAQKEEVARVTAEERRKLEGKTILSTPQSTSGSIAREDGTRQYYSFTKLEVPIKSINDWEAEEVYYGFEADNELLQFVAMLTRDSHPHNVLGNPMRGHARTFSEWTDKKWYRLHKNFVEDSKVNNWNAFNMQHFFDTNVMLIKVAQNNARYYRDFQHVQEFFINIKNNTITMSNTLIQWNTARILKDKLAQAAFLHNFDRFNPEYAAMYQSLTEYVDKHYREVQEYTDKNTYGVNKTTYNDLLTHLENVRKFQEFVAKGNAPEAVARLAQDLFGNRELSDGMAVDPRMIQMFEDVQAYCNAVGPMLNYIPVLTGYSGDVAYANRNYKPGESRVRNNVPEELELEIRMLLEHKGVLDYKTTLEQEVDQIASEIEHASKEPEYLEEEPIEAAS